MLADIKETLERLQVINPKLNPKKCSFGVEEVRFLGHLITKADPSKVKAISDLQPLKSISKIQSLSKKLAEINRVEIRRLLDDLRVTVAKLMLLVYKLLLLVFKVNTAGTKLQLLKDYNY
ncbi:hypothetical protein Tco_1530032 [Tanacetum coccineum]